MNLYKKNAWKKKRERVLRRDNYQCQILKRYGRTAEATTVHHILPAEYYPEYALSSWNLISVSREGHNLLHSRENHELTQEGTRLIKELERRGYPPSRGSYVRSMGTAGGAISECAEKARSGDNPGTDKNDEENMEDKN